MPKDKARKKSTNFCIVLTVQSFLLTCKIELNMIRLAKNLQDVWASLVTQKTSCIHDNFVAMQIKSLFLN